jgi:hypothetical protein
MIKKLLLNALIFSGLLASAQTTFTVTYDFAATTTVSGTTDPTPSPTVTGITCGSFVAVGTPSTNPNAGGRFSFVGWPTGGVNGATTYSSMTGSISTSEYYEVTLTPINGYTVTLNSIGLKFQRSGTGVRSYAVRSSLDTYNANLPASVTSNTNITVEGTNEFFVVPDASSSYLGSLVDLTATTFTFATTTSFRFYGWNSEAASGTFSIDDVVFDGSVAGGTVACVPASISAITGNIAICANQSLNLGSVVLGDTPFTYTWTGAGSLATPNASNTSITNATSTDYTLTVENACGTATSVVTATVNALPTVAYSAAAYSLQCIFTNSMTLSGGTPSGGVYSGAGVTGNDFSPSTAGIGPHTITYMYTDANNCSNMASDVLTVDVCSGIQTLDAELVSIYPNPSNGLVVVKTPLLNAQVSVFDINGKKVLTQTTSSFETSLDLSHLANGVYQLNIVSENSSINHKVMINK